MTEDVVSYPDMAKDETWTEGYLYSFPHSQSYAHGKVRVNSHGILDDEDGTPIEDFGDYAFILEEVTIEEAFRQWHEALAAR